MDPTKNRSSFREKGKWTSSYGITKWIYEAAQSAFISIKTFEPVLVSKSSIDMAELASLIFNVLTKGHKRNVHHLFRQKFWSRL